MKLSVCALLTALSTFSFVGCASYVPIATGTPTLVLSKPEQRSSRLGLKIALPAGDYIPDFANENGIFYLAPTSVMFSNLGMNNPLRGGVYVPSPGAKDQRQAAWAQISTPGGLTGIISSGSSSIYTYPLDQPVSFSVKSANPPSPTTKP
jgi:hypothetical protein